MPIARSTFASRSCSSATVAVATYGISCAIAINGTLFPWPNTLPGSSLGGLRVGGPGPGRCRARTLHARVHVGLVVVTDVEHIVAALEHPGEGAEADVDGGAVTALRDDALVASLDLSAAAMPVATAGAFANSEWIQGSCQDDSGYGVEKTSRQPVAFAAIRRPFVARIAASSAYLAPSASPHPWQARWPKVSVLERPSRACTVRASGVEQAVARGEAPDLEELDWLIGHLVAPQWAPARTTPRSRRRFSACGPDRRSYFWRCSSRSTRP